MGDASSETRDRVCLDAEQLLEFCATALRTAGATSTRTASELCRST